MKKIRIAFWVICFALLLPLISCNTGAKPNKTESTQTGDAGTVTSSPEGSDGTTGGGEDPTPQPKMLTLFDGSVNCRILDGSSTPNAKGFVQSFMTDVTEKTGCILGYSSINADDHVPEIVVGTVSERPESVAVYNALRWSGRDIRIIGNKIYVNTRSEIYLEQLLRTLLNAMTKTEKGWEIAMDFTYSKDAGKLDAELPMLETAGSDAGVMPSGDGERYVATYKDVTEAEYNAYVAKLTAAGFVAFDEYSANGNHFGTYTKGRTQVNLCFYSVRATFKILYGKTDTIPSLTKPETEELVTPTLTQLVRKSVDESSPNGASGMGYVIQLSDGRYILIDGGSVDTNNEDAGALLDYLVAHKPASHEKPIIAAWIISHAHGDHILLPNQFLKDYHDKVVLEMTITNFPYFSKLQMKYENSEPLAGFISQFESYVSAYFPRAKQITAHTGQRFWVGDAYLEFFYSHEDEYPTLPGWANETSLVFRMTLGGKTCMFLGDLDQCAFMRDVWGSEVKSDILQVAHHGYNGGDLKLYQNIDPEICLWSSDEWRFLNDPRCLGTQSGYEFNKWLRDSSVRERKHYHNSVTTIISLKGADTSVETIG